MQLPSISARTGAIIGILGTVIVFISYFLAFIVYPGSLSPVVLWILLPLSLTILAVSVRACYWNLSRRLRALYCGSSILSFLLQLFVYGATQLFACMDICNPGATTTSYWILMGLGGFLLSIVGAFVTLGG